jgi:hypothetical protein
MNLGQMDSRQRRLAIVALLGVGLLAGDRLVLTPLVKSWKTRAEQIARLHRSVTDGTLLVQRETAIRTRWDEMRTNTLDRQVSVAESQVLKAFDRWSRDSGVSISSLRPQWKRGAEGYATLECRADAGGNLANLTRFLYAAETDPLALKVDVVELTARDAEGQQLTLGLQVSGLVLQLSGS